MNPLIFPVRLRTVVYSSLWLVLALWLVGSGCKTNSPELPPAEVAAMQSTPVRINPGDVVQITFPGGPQTMNTPPQRVRVDGKVALPLVGDVAVAGKTPVELQAELAKLYDKQLDIKEVVVVVSSSAASVFVSGAVARPGRISMERPLTVLDAIMEAGGFDPRRANVKKIRIIRQKGRRYEKREINLKPVLRGENVTPFMLEPFDIIYVPEKLF
ncbi:MAG: polysaccharide biosynthesis/export family protein [Verrucomicrobiota bacterium]